MWISEQIEQMVKMYNVILGTEGTEMSLVERYSIVSTNKQLFRLEPSMKDCAGNENDECALSRVLRSGKAYCSDFDIKSSTYAFRSVSNAHTVMDASVEVPSQRSSCCRCFYNRLVYELISRVEHADLSARMKINGSDRDVSLLGIGYSESKDSGRRRACLSLRCTIGKETKTFLIARINNVLCYLELIPTRGISSSGYSHYLIGKEGNYQILMGEAHVEPQPIDTIDFKTSGNAVENLYATHRQQFDMAFRLYFGKLASGATHREIISKKLQSKPAEQTNASHPQATLLDSPILKVAIGMSFVWIVVILVRESRTRRVEKISIL